MTLVPYYVRLELRTRTDKFDRALRADVRDALWMLTRQWQMGELTGDDAASPISARIRITSTRLRKVQAGEKGRVEAFTDDEPLETRVERRPLVFSLDLRMLMGRQWGKMLRADGLDDLTGAFVAKYPVAAPDPTKAGDAMICAHEESWSAFAAAAGRRMDGAKLYEHLRDPAHHAWDGIFAAAGREARIDAVAARFRKWFDRLIEQPGESDAWLPDRLEYRFACAAPRKSDEKVLSADEYYHGHLDWYCVEHEPIPRLGPDPIPFDPALPYSEKKEVIPVPATFSGMPNTRWWRFEEGRTNFGNVKPDTTDLAKLLLIEFGLTYANDWFVVPYQLPAGSIAIIDGLAVTDVFGERIWVEPAGSGTARAWQRWAMFLANVKGDGKALADTSLLLLPVASKVLESEPIESVLLVRDEIANMVWAIEDVVPLATGEPKRGAEAARELRAFYERTHPATPPPPPVADVRYDLIHTPPENWIPFVPVQVAGDRRSIQLQRGAMLRILPGERTPEKIRPRTALMREGLDASKGYFVHEEEVPRAGIVVTQSYQRTRWRDGRPWVWLGVRKQTGRGEASSGLAFDRVVPVERKT